MPTLVFSEKKRATFAATPEAESLRPDVHGSGAGGFPGVLLAGDYCKTGWPATMEGATRAGYAAAAAILGQPPDAFIPPDRPVGALARRLGLRRPESV